MSLHLRRGGGPVDTGGGGGGGETGIYGPSTGRAAVIAAAVTRTVTNPGGGIAFNSSGSLQTAINNNAAGSTFVCSTLTPSWNTSVDTGTKNPTIIFPGTPGQCVINGGGSQIVAIEARGTTVIKGGTWTNFGSTGTTGIATKLHDSASVYDMEAYNCSRMGIGTFGTGVLVDHCYTHDNGEYGVHGTLPAAQGTIRYTHIDNNNTSQSDPGWDAGGTKFLCTSNNAVYLRLQNCYVHDNYGSGLWLDYYHQGANGQALIEECVIEDNLRWGLFYEASFGQAVIRHNWIKNNCQTGNVMHANLAITCSDGTLGSGGGIEITYNHIEGSTYLAMLGNHDVHPYDTKGVTFKNNKVRFTGASARVGGYDNQATKTLWTEPLTWDYNLYEVQSLTTSHWYWGSGTGSGSARSWATWQGYGFDANSTRSVI